MIVILILGIVFGLGSLLWAILTIVSVKSKEREKERTENLKEEIMEIDAEIMEIDAEIMERETEEERIERKNRIEKERIEEEKIEKKDRKEKERIEKEEKARVYNTSIIFTDKIKKREEEMINATVEYKELIKEEIALITLEREIINGRTGVFSSITERDKKFGELKDKKQKLRKENKAFISEKEL